ncbi:MAG: FtsX-like permease family protein [Acidobacteria bacterium]|nr:FtsX-like permease family protein [Acidobacteriota bacterium]
MEATGLTAAEAKSQAARQLGGAAQWREQTRDADVLVTLDAWVRDARLAWRGLVRRPGLMAAVVGSLAEGIALNTSAFSVVDAVLLKSLPLRRAGEVMRLQETIEGDRVGANPARLRDWRAQATALTDFAGIYGEGLVMTGRGDVERIDALRTVGSPLRLLATQPMLGRAFTGRLFVDRAGAPAEVVLNQTFAEKLLAGRNPLGMHIANGREAEDGKPVQWMEIVGVVGDVRRTPLEAAVHPGFYQSYQQGYWPMNEFVLETSIPLTASAIRGAVQRVDANQPVVAVQTLEVSLSRYMAQPRVQALLIRAFALGALLLAALGLYGLLASDVAQRTQEMGVRLALGATPAQLVAMLVRQGAGVAGVGLLAGIAAAVALARSLARSLAGSIAGIPDLTWQAPAAASALLIVVAVLASLLPTRHAAAVALASALRCD